VPIRRAREDRLGEAAVCRREVAKGRREIAQDDRRPARVDLSLAVGRIGEVRPEDGERPLERDLGPRQRRALVHARRACWTHRRQCDGEDDDDPERFTH